MKDRRGREAKLEPAYVNDLIEHVAPCDPDARGSAYVRTATIDANLGEGLCLLAALVHAEMASSEPEPNLSKTVQPRKYQSIQQRDASERLLFKPSGNDDLYFKNYIARINSAGWRSGGNFPGSIFLGGAYLRGADLDRADLSGANLNDADFDGAHLSGAIFTDKEIEEARFEEVIFNNKVCDRETLLRQLREREEKAEKKQDT